MSTFESTQSVEVVTADHSHELSFIFELECTNPSTREIPASLSQPGEPGEAPEFELSQVRIDTNELLLDFGYLQNGIFYALVGEEIAEALIARATTEAIESGEF